MEKFNTKSEQFISNMSKKNRFNRRLFLKSSQVDINNIIYNNKIVNDEFLSQKEFVRLIEITLQEKKMNKNLAFYPFLKDETIEIDQKLLYKIYEALKFIT